jgi:thiol-disulfide isomerase/thioredoxin
MKKIIAVLFIFFSIAPLFGQLKDNPEPFVIKGQLIDCPEKNLKIFFKDKNGQSLVDTIHLDINGNFYLTTFKVQGPQRTSIQQNNIQINDFFVAPGYNLTITGNGKNFISLQKTKKVTGIGSESNRYRFMLDSILSARMDTTRSYQLNESDLLAYIKKYIKLQDSIAHLVFDRKAVQDKYLNYFGKMVRFDNKFFELYMLLSHADMNRYNYEKTTTFLRNNFDNSILDNLYRDEYLISDDYKYGLIGNEYLKYLLSLDYQKDSALRNRKGYKLEKINKVYKGKVKEFVLQSIMISSIEYCKSFDKLNEYKEQFEIYFSTFSNPFYKKSIVTKFSEKETELLRTEIGKPAPKFTLESNLGNSYSLEDYKGKVVYLDLWASWCAPCRAETPSFKILISKYKNDNRIAFLSIAVHDGINDWKKALEEDKPDWVQLLDKEGTVWKSYVANTIPKFILIDKEGKIVNFDAPWPSSGEEIERLLNREIAK